MTPGPLSNGLVRPTISQQPQEGTCLYSKSQFSKSQPRRKPRRAQAKSSCSVPARSLLATTSLLPSLPSWTGKSRKTSTDHEWRYSSALLPSACSTGGCEPSQADGSGNSGSYAGAEARKAEGRRLGLCCSKVPGPRRQLPERANRDCNLLRHQSGALSSSPSPCGSPLARTSVSCLRPGFGRGAFYNDGAQ